ncbi:hypothetical protein [Azospirillum formosense]|uniref:hypothetical protein n=1 Tax=Azospirillum formosense TaxID=861533 RepID=UPI00338E01A9
MDHQRLKLDNIREKAGRTVLELTDGLGFDTQAAGWIYMDDSAEGEREWRLYLITPMIDEKGPVWIYERLLKVFRKVGLPEGITPLDIYIAGPKDGLFLALQKFLHPEGDGLLEVSDSSFEDHEFSFSVKYIAFYRIKTKPIKAKPALFAKKVEQLLAA